LAAVQVASTQLWLQVAGGVSEGAGVGSSEGAGFWGSAGFWEGLGDGATLLDGGGVLLPGASVDPQATRERHMASTSARQMSFFIVIPLSFTKLQILVKLFYHKISNFQSPTIAKLAVIHKKMAKASEITLHLLTKNTEGKNSSLANWRRKCEADSKTEPQRRLPLGICFDFSNCHISSAHNKHFPSTSSIKRAIAGL